MYSLTLATFIDFIPISIPILIFILLFKEFHCSLTQKRVTNYSMKVNYEHIAPSRQATEKELSTLFHARRKPDKRILTYLAHDSVYTLWLMIQFLL